VGVYVPNNLARFVGQGVHHAVHQLGEQSPIFVLLYAVHQVIGVLPLGHGTTTSTWVIGIGAKIEVIHITLNVRCVLLYRLTIAQSHCWHLLSQCRNIQLHLWHVPLLQLFTQRLCIFLNSILRLQWPLHRKENGRMCDSMLYLPWFTLCPVLGVRYFLSTIGNAEDLLLLEENFDFQTAAIVVGNNKLPNWDQCWFSCLRYKWSQSVLLGDPVNDASIQNLFPDAVGWISEVSNLIACCAVSAVLNVSIDLKLTDFLAKYNWHVHWNKSGCASAGHSHKPTYLMTTPKSVPTALSLNTYSFGILSMITMQSLPLIHCLPLHFLLQYHILLVRNIPCNLHSL